MHTLCFLLSNIKFQSYSITISWTDGHILLEDKGSNFIVRSMSKETPEKVYRSVDSAIDLSSCRLCRAIGDPSHRKNLFKPSNRALLRIAEVLCGYPIVQDSSLPHLVCRPCERRLNNCLELQKVIQKTEESLQQRQSGSIRVKRCVSVSPSISRPQKSRLSSFKSPARTSLSFNVGQEGSSLNPDKEVILHSYLL